MKSEGRAQHTGPDKAHNSGLDEEFVAGERATPVAHRTRSLQSRVSSVLACGLMILLGAGVLTWYYSTTFTRQARARRAVETTSANRARGEMPLPALDHRFDPQASDPVPPKQANASSLVASETPPELPLASSRDCVATQETPTSQSTSSADAYGAPMPKSPGQIALERRLSGAAFAQVSTSGTAAQRVTSPPVSPSPDGLPFEAARFDAQRAGGPRADEDLSRLLRTETRSPVQAQLLTAPRLLLPKGAFIDCTLETAIDSTFPGMTTCITATDTFGADGTIVLLERGTKLIGETRGQIQQGAARVFVLWTEARTPGGVVVPLDSPGSDELGRSGLPGDVDRHFWERFGSAILISAVNGAVQAAVQSTSHGGGAIVYDPSGSQNIVTDVLKSTVNIPPTVIKRNGDRIQVLVARDLDFRPVYALRPTSSPR